MALVAEQLVVLIKVLGLKVVLEEGRDVLRLFSVLREGKNVVQDLLLSVGLRLALAADEPRNYPVEEQALKFLLKD